MKSKESFTLVLEGEIAPSINDFYAGKHWTTRKALVDRIFQLVQQALQIHTLLTKTKLPRFQYPVKIKVHAHYAHHALDSDNVFEKPYIDAIKRHHRLKVGRTYKAIENKYWLIDDDDPRYVGPVTRWSIPDKTGPRVEITIEEI